MYDADSEFDRQVDRLVELGYPGLAGRTDDDFRALVAPLRAAARQGTAGLPAPTEGRVPFLLVTTRELIPVAERLGLTTLDGKRKPGVLDRNYAEGDLARFDPIKELEVPESPAYLLFDVDRGADLVNLAPAAAMEVITGKDRLPLTIDEGIAFVTLHPSALAKNKCFSLVGSRCGDKRVPAIWISQGAPKLGWCWYGNPHTWLGSASARPERVGLS
ncbi:DUF5701 family protein [Micromonospora krabiensis]|uniref:Uncharacterized protein n=1 Tax=Micromonospora krabiensis TaxID=307121 RepID=A0A1C3N8Z1_9ACTN|nr:DUF5701 family protein [Micromonospora krabiensis]SBV28996.1 hypothetical protein GA0070620_4555 [Micromonospora krabiensis]